MCGYYNIPYFYIKIKQVIKNEQDNAIGGRVSDHPESAALRTAAGLERAGAFAEADMNRQEKR
jgi:hypothetical protein